MCLSVIKEQCGQSFMNECVLAPFHCQQKQHKHSHLFSEAFTVSAGICRLTG